LLLMVVPSGSEDGRSAQNKRLFRFAASRAFRRFSTATTDHAAALIVTPPT